MYINLLQDIKEVSSTNFKSIRAVAEAFIVGKQFWEIISNTIYISP